MERQDWSMICADCIVLSCCCQCLLLQFLVFVLLKLPAKLLKKTKLYMKRKFGKGGKMVRMKVARCAEEVVGRKKPRGLMRVRPRPENFLVDGFGGCMEEVEEVLEELSTKGEFGFGSFWRGDDEDDVIEVHFPMCLANQEIRHPHHAFGPF